MNPPLTSIVILTRNGLELTRACVASIDRHTNEPYELIFVDNGSTDGTLEYLNSVPAAFVIDNGENVGFGGGCNQGIAASRGDRILLLNNDVVVTAGWLQALHRVLDADARIGIVGPRTNNIVGEQRIADVGYDTSSLDGLDAWSARWCAEHRGQTSHMLRLVGFCLLARRDVFERIGGFDLRFGIGNFEDDDLCMRAAVAGFEARVVHDAFLHHVGHGTFDAEGINYQTTIRDNLQQLISAWHLTAEEISPDGSYDAHRVVARTRWDATKHFMPFDARPASGNRLELDAGRSKVVGVFCERTEPDTTRLLLRTAVHRSQPDDDVTLVIRIDPRDEEARRELEEVADEVGDARLPDIVIVEASDFCDAPMYAACDHVLVAGRTSWSRACAAPHYDAVAEHIERSATGHS